MIQANTSATTDWDYIPENVGKPDFNNLLAVLHRQVPSRPTLFEFFLNERLYKRLVGPVSNIPEGKYSQQLVTMLAFCQAGYDYTTLLVPGFEFPSGRVKLLQTVSLNQGALIVDRDSYNTYPWPDPEGAEFEILDYLAERLPHGMKLIGYSPEGVLENAIKLVGYEKLCYLLTDDEKLVFDIFEAIGARLVRYYEIVARHDAIGACIVNDDWGFKTQTLFSPKALRRFVFPWQKKIVATIHDASKPAILHSCGHFERIIDDITEDMQFDARHSYEDAILPIEEAYERYHQRIAMLGGIDVDFICRSHPEEVYHRSRAMLERAKNRGRYALGTGNSVPDYVPDAGYFAMLRAALEER